MPPSLSRNVLKKDHSEIESETTFNYLSLNFMHINFTESNTTMCKICIAVSYTYFYNNKNESMYCIAMQFVDLASWTKCFVTSGVESAQIEL